MNWYRTTTGSHQGLIIDEDTGENIAVAYDEKHTQLTAAAPDLLEALQAMFDEACTTDEFSLAIKEQAFDAIQKATP